MFGFLVIPIQGLKALLAEIRSGHPGIVFENLALSWAPRWHYAVVLGYDLDKEEVIMHSGHDSFAHVDLREFESSWKLGDYWGLVVLPPNELAVSANEEMHVSAVAALEQIRKLEESKRAYQQILTRWPKSLGAMIGLANVAFTQNELRTSIDLLKAAIVAHPKSAAAWHNLAIAQGTVGWGASAHESAMKALELASANARPQYRKNLRKLLR
jgi:hypothetical protein